jgi:truncated hemoglobin YjbI
LLSYKLFEHFYEHVIHQQLLLSYKLVEHFYEHVLHQLPK